MKTFTDVLWKGIKNWKTTAGGISVMSAAIADIAHQASTGTWDGNRLYADILAIGTGITLIFAKDANAK